MSAADHIVRLDEIADPTAFLTGARIPLGSPSGNRIEIIGEYLLICNYSGELPLTRPVGHWSPGWRLDCADPAVATWVDRKIAATFDVYNPEYTCLGRVDGEWVFWCLGEARGIVLIERRPALVSVLAHVPQHPDAVPTARAALLRALYGVKK
jgi:hypothetical protein